VEENPAEFLIIQFNEKFQDIFEERWGSENAGAVFQPPGMARLCHSSLLP
jgi:hypothetical protein